MSEREAETRRIEIELALRTGQWPEWARGAAAVERYRLGQPRGGGGNELLGLYEPSLRAEVSANWATHSLGHLRELERLAGKPLDRITAQDAQACLDQVTRTAGPARPKGRGRSRATRNRMLAACSRFYKWAVRGGHLRANPFTGIRTLKESRTSEIVYLTREERDELLEGAGDSGPGLALWLAFYTGMRRGEIYRCRWRDVHLDRLRISVPTSKTGAPRTVPMARALAERLELVPKGRRRGSVVPRSVGRGWAEAAKDMMTRAWAACPQIPRGRVRWNSFRHTFGSLLAQDGVSLDKISAWMGNSSEICRRHYTQFVPRDRHDEDIERL